MVKLIPGVAMAAALLSAQPVRAAAIYVALGDSITFGETDLRACHKTTALFFDLCGWMV